MNEKYITHHVKTNTNRYIGTVTISEDHGDLMVTISRVKDPLDTFSKSVGHNLALTRLHKWGISFDRANVVVNYNINDETINADSFKDIRSKIYERMSKRMFNGVISKIERAKKYYKFTGNVVTYIKVSKEIIKYTQSAI